MSLRNLGAVLPRLVLAVCLDEADAVALVAKAHKRETSVAVIATLAGGRRIRRWGRRWRGRESSSATVLAANGQRHIRARHRCSVVDACAGYALELRRSDRDDVQGDAGAEAARRRRSDHGRKFAG